MVHSEYNRNVILFSYSGEIAEARGEIIIINQKEVETKAWLAIWIGFSSQLFDISWLIPPALSHLMRRI